MIRVGKGKTEESSPKICIGSIKVPWTGCPWDQGACKLNDGVKTPLLQRDLPVSGNSPYNDRQTKGFISGTDGGESEHGDWEKGASPRHPHQTWTGQTIPDEKVRQIASVMRRPGGEGSETWGKREDG